MISEVLKQGNKRWVPFHTWELILTLKILLISVSRST